MVTDESPFSLCYGAEIILLAELSYTMTRADIFNPTHEESMALKADLLEGKRDHAYMHLMNYRQMLF